MSATSADAAPQVVIVSGGSRGLGLSVVRYLLEGGHHVAAFSRGTSEAIDLLLSDNAARLVFHEVDARDATQLHDFVGTVRQRFGRVDGLVNNAGVAHDGVLAVMRETDIEMMLDVNLKGAILLAKEAARAMLLQSSGSIVNISSIIGQRGFSGLAAYASTKAGLLGLTYSLARELGPRNIRVNAIAPGYLETEMSEGLDAAQRQQIIRRTPLGRLGSTDDVCPVIEFLLSPASQFITGQVITVDGGASV